MGALANTAAETSAVVVAARGVRGPRERRRWDQPSAASAASTASAASGAFAAAHAVAHAVAASALTKP